MAALPLQSIKDRNLQTGKTQSCMARIYATAVPQVVHLTRSSGINQLPDAHLAARQGP
jgi:hypothetical protein